MKEKRDKEVLDFCRVKKIFEKGFGFLTSLYYPENVFFHFSKINDEEKRKALSALKRGVVTLFYTSKLSNGKRKVDEVWLNIEDVPEELFTDFISRLILELNDGKTNPFEIIEVLSQLRRIKKLTEQNYQDIISSKRISKITSILLKIFSEDEKEILDKVTYFLEELKSKNLSELEQREYLISLVKNL